MSDDDWDETTDGYGGTISNPTPSFNSVGRGFSGNSAKSQNGFGFGRGRGRGFARSDQDREWRGGSQSQKADNMNGSNSGGIVLDVPNHRLGRIIGAYEGRFHAEIQSVRFVVLLGRTGRTVQKWLSR